MTKLKFLHIFSRYHLWKLVAQFLYGFYWQQCWKSRIFLRLRFLCEINRRWYVGCTFGLPACYPDENKNKTKLFSFGITRGSPKWTLNISPPIIVLQRISLQKVWNFPKIAEFFPFVPKYVISNNSKGLKAKQILCF